MNSLVTTNKTINHSLAEYAYNARGAFSKNTERAFKNDADIFMAWCSENKRIALPSSPETLVSFIDNMAGQKASATIRRYVSSISTYHRAANFAGKDNPALSMEVKLALKRMHRDKGKRQKQAFGITFDLRNRMLGACGTKLIDCRNKAILAIAYDTGCRRSEIVALKIEDITKEEDGTGAILIKRSKTDQEGQGMIRFIARDTMGMITCWLEKAGITKDPLFRTVKYGKVTQNNLDAGDISRIFKRMAMSANVPLETIKNISGHSTRVGMAQDMAVNGIKLPEIMQSGGWKSPVMVARYTERVDVKSGGSAKLASLQNRL